MVHTEGTPARATALPVSAPHDEFTQLFRDKRREIIKMLVVLGASKSEAEDASQQAFLELFRNRKTVKNPYPWVRKAAKSNFFKICNIRSKESPLEEPPQGPLPEALMVQEMDTGIVDWEDRQWIEQLLDTLSGAMREVMELILEDFSGAEIAERLGKTQGSVRVNLHFARERLKGELCQDYKITGKTPKPRGEVK